VWWPFSGFWRIAGKNWQEVKPAQTIEATAQGGFEDGDPSLAERSLLTAFPHRASSLGSIDPTRLLLRCCWVVKDPFIRETLTTLTKRNNSFDIDLMAPSGVRKQ